MANINSKNAARKKVREAQARANEARQECERLNVDDTASFLVELGRLAAVDEWEQDRIEAIRAEGNRRRHGHRRTGAAALSRMVDRGETLTAIAKLAGVKVREVRAVLKSVNGLLDPPADASGPPYHAVAASHRAGECPANAAGAAVGDAARQIGVGGGA
jgi:hypothetical protein